MGKQKNLLKRFLNGTANNEETNKVETWLDGAEKENNPWADLSDNEKTAFLNDLKKEIDASNQTGEQGPKGAARWLWLAAAAVIIGLMIPIYGLWIRPPATITSPKLAVQKIVETNIAEVKQLELSDGSKVWLNAKSSLRYTDSFGIQSRDVYLDGQAYFEIARDTRKPFIVHANSWQVTVLGTHFDIFDYKEDNDVAVSVLAGKVAVRSIKKSAAPSIIHPGQALKYDKNKDALNTGRFSPADRPTWIRKEVVFYHTTMGEVANYIQRNYGFTVHFADPKMKEMELSGDFGKIENISDLLDLICLTINARFTIDEKNIMITNMH